MVRKSVLIYRLLKSNNNQGLTKNEIVKILKEKYNFPLKTNIREEVRIALRTGIDFGIISEEDEKYKFVTLREKKISKQRRRKSKCKKCSTNSQEENSSQVNSNQNRRPPEVPNPTVPNLPNFNPIRRDVRQEPFAKLVKHQKAKKKD